MNRCPASRYLWAVVGLVILFAVAAIDYRYLTSSHWYIYAGVLASLVLVIVAGQLGNETRRWIQITPTLRIQPSEFGRILLTITFAQFLVTRQDFMDRFSNTLLTIGLYRSSHGPDLPAAGPGYVHPLHLHLVCDDLGCRPAAVSILLALGGDWHPQHRFDVSLAG